MPLVGDGRSGTFSALPNLYGGYKSGATAAPSGYVVAPSRRVLAAGNPPVDTLTDDFVTQDVAKWTFGTGATVSGGQLQELPNPAYTATATTNSPCDLTGGAAIVEGVQPPNIGTGTTQWFATLYRDNVNGDTVKWLWNNGALIAQYTVAGVASNPATLTYSGTTHRWWRIRESAGTVYWDTSPDRTTWTQQASWVATFALTGLSVQLGAAYYGTEPTPGVAIFDNVNVAPPAIPVGTGTGTTTASGSATGVRTPKATATGTVTTTGSAAGKRTPKATSSGTVTTTGSATGTRTPRGTAIGTVTTTGSAAGKRVAKAAPVGTVTATGTATGITTRRATATGTVTATGSATGNRAPKAAATGTVTTTGTATGRRVPKATATGTVTSTGSAVGSAPLVGVNDGTATGTTTATGSAAGRRQPVASSTGTTTATGTATGKRTPKAVTTGTVTVTGTAVGAAPAVGLRTGTASGAVTVTGMAAGRRFAKALTLGAVTVTGVAIGSSPGGEVVHAGPTETLTVGADNRVATIGADRRTSEVRGEVRRFQAVADQRTDTVPAATRNLATVGS